MDQLMRLTIILGPMCCLLASTAGQDSKSKSSSVFTLLGTVKGEVTKVSDGGKRVEVKYKELVTSTRSITNPYMTRGSTSARFRPPLQKEMFLKEKNQELDLRVMDKTIIRVLDTRELPGDQEKKKKAAEEKQDDKDTAEENEMKKAKKQKDDAKESEMAEDAKKEKQDKGNGKSARKPAEPPMPGKPGDPGSLVKGQYVVVTVYREDLPGYNRLVAGSIYILGEK